MDKKNASVLKGPLGIVLGLASAVAVVAILFLAGWLMSNRAGRQDVAGGRAQPPAGQAAAPAAPAQTAAKQDAAASKAPQQSVEKQAATRLPTVAPTFDMVRIEPSGDAVLAGQAAPGSRVELLANSVKVAEAVADAAGNWAMVLDKPLPPGAIDLSLMATTKDGDADGAVRSRQLIAVVVDPDGKTQPLVVAQDDAGSHVLQQPREETVAAAAPAQSQLGQSQPVQSAPAQAAPAPAPVAGEAPPAPAPVAAAPQRETAAAATAPQPRTGVATVIEAADYDPSGQLRISGTAEPGAALRLYYDNVLAGDTQADAGGRWSLMLSKGLDGTVHALRADRIDPDTGAVRARAEVSFIAELPDEQKQQIAAAAVAPQPAPEPVPSAGSQQPAPAEPAVAVAPAGSAEQVAAVPAPAPAESRTEEVNRSRITVARGDSLWRIAREHYGRGVRYTTIFDANRDQIRNPNLIYPDQVFLVPRLKDGNQTTN